MVLLVYPGYYGMALYGLLECFTQCADESGRLLRGFRLDEWAGLGWAGLESNQCVSCV